MERALNSIIQFFSLTSNYKRIIFGRFENDDRSQYITVSSVCHFESECSQIPFHSILMFPLRLWLEGFSNDKPFTPFE